MANEDTSTFTGEGFDSYPNLHFDRMTVSEVADETVWPDERLIEKILEHEEFQRRPGILPHHLEASKEILDLLGFEGGQRQIERTCPDDISEIEDGKGA